MKAIEIGTVGECTSSEDSVRWKDLSLDDSAAAIVAEIAPGTLPTEVQVKVFQSGIFKRSRKHLLISSPTNSGKSLIAYLGAFSALKEKKRVLLIEPLRSIAEEKLIELQRLTGMLEVILGRKVGVDIATGDYQLNGDTLQSEPPKAGEVVVATPERIEGVMRNPDYAPWINSFSFVCVDEAHLIGDRLRGACLEFVTTCFLTLKSPPRVVLMSATLGNTEEIEKWLNPCDVIKSTIRRPKLSQVIMELEEQESPNEAIVSLAAEILQNRGHSLLIFVYQKASTEKLASMLNESLGNLCGFSGALAYHSGLNRQTKQFVQREYLSGNSRCVVSA